jgi:hypothetical protein
MYDDKDNTLQGSKLKLVNETLKKLIVVGYPCLLTLYVGTGKHYPSI